MSGSGSANTVRVVIADDHPPTRAGVRVSLTGHGFEVVAEAGDADGAVAAALEHRPEVCLLDVHMPGGGVRAAGEITSRLPHTAVVMLTVSRDDGDLFDALKAGAEGYLLKDIDPARLPLALRGVLDGEAALPRSLTSRLIEEFRGRNRRLPLLGQRGARLSDKEWQVLELLRDGATTAEIADRLYISPATVRSHVSAILRKLRVSSRAEALRLLDEEPG